MCKIVRSMFENNRRRTARVMLILFREEFVENVGEMFVGIQNINVCVCRLNIVCIHEPWYRIIIRKS